MCRLLIAGLALTVLSPVWAYDDAKKSSDKELKVEGKLTKDDPADKVLKNPHKVHQYNMKSGSIYVIDLKSRDFDAYLRVEDPTGKQVAANDDATPDTLDSRIVLTAAKDGTHKIIATCLDGKPGAYTLTVRAGTKEDIIKADPFHALLGKPAPELTSEFSFNGETKKLSDLKGKVVLLDFWAVWCGPCIRTFPHLRDWDKQFKKDGLEVVGVTTYFQSLAFDKDNGRVIPAVKKVKDDKTGDVKTEKVKLKPAEEHDMLKDFAGYHKLPYRMMSVSQEGWKGASEAYKIQGIPHAVLVDRKGMIRMVRVGASPENATALEEEIRKLIAEK